MDVLSAHRTARDELKTLLSRWELLFEGTESGDENRMPRRRSDMHAVSLEVPRRAEPAELTFAAVAEDHPRRRVRLPAVPDEELGAGGRPDERDVRDRASALAALRPASRDTSRVAARYRPLDRARLVPRRRATQASEERSEAGAPRSAGACLRRGPSRPSSKRGFAPSQPGSARSSRCGSCSTSRATRPHACSVSRSLPSRRDSTGHSESWKRG